ncbi:MAG: threonine-phosphate decarboxylase [Clostridia bacterium]
MLRYEHGGDVYSTAGIRLDFSINLNPLGMPDEIKAAIIQNINSYCAYPDPLCRTLCAAIAHKNNIKAEHVLCGNGAADLIFRLCLALRPNNVLLCTPTFSEYEKAALLSGAKTIYHTLREQDGFGLTDRILDALTPDIDMLFLCNPNNPTGALAPRGLIEDIAMRCNKNGTLLVLDECFIDFTDENSYLPLIIEYPNLVILRAFTKLYSMAGLRLGYMLCSNITLLAATAGAAQTWSVSSAAQTAGLAALSLDGWEERTKRLVRAERSFLMDGLSALGLTVFPSNANFMLLKSDISLYEPLLAHGILIRRCENFAGLDTHFFRIGIKTREKNIELLSMIAKSLM